MIELTARLTLQSCVSQLTDFYSTSILETIIDYGMQEFIIRLCDSGGELLPYTVVLEPEGTQGDLDIFRPKAILVKVLHSQNTSVYGNEVFLARVQKLDMPTKNLFKCALHVAGDYIKFNEKGR